MIEINTIDDVIEIAFQYIEISWDDAPIAHVIRKAELVNYQDGEFTFTVPPYQLRLFQASGRFLSQCIQHWMPLGSDPVRVSFVNKREGLR